MATSNNPKHVFDFEGILNMNADPKHWKKLKKQLEEAFGELKIAIQDGLAEDEAQRIVDQFNKIFRQAKLPDIGIDDLKNDFAKLEIYVERAAAAINGIAIDNLEDVLNELKLINAEVVKISKNKGGIKLFDEANLKKVMTDVGRIAKEITKSTNPLVKSITEIDEAVARSKVSASQIQDALDYKGRGGGKKGAEDLHDYYSGYTSLDPDASWEEQYIWMVKFTKAYEDYMSKQKKATLESAEFIKSMEAYTNLYNKNKAGNADRHNMLQNIINRGKGVALVGYTKEPWALEETLQEIKNILQGGLKVDVGEGGNNKPAKNHDAPQKGAKGGGDAVIENTLKDIKNILQKTYEASSKGIYENINKIAQAYGRAIGTLSDDEMADENVVNSLMDKYLNKFMSAFPTKDLDNLARSKEVKKAFESFSAGDLDTAQFQTRLRSIINNTLDKVLIDFSEDAAMQLQDAFESGNQSSDAKEVVKTEGGTVVIDPNALADALGKMQVTADNKDVVTELQNAEKSLGKLVAQDETLKSLKESIGNITVTPDNSEVVGALKTLAQNLLNLAQEDTLQAIKNNNTRLTKEDITAATKEAIYAKEFAANYKPIEFKDAFKSRNPDDWMDDVIDQEYGQFLTIDEALEQFEARFQGRFMNRNKPLVDGDYGTKEQVIDNLINEMSAAKNSETENWVKVIIEAIQDQTGKIVQSIKLLLPQEIVDGVDDAKLIDAFNVLIQAIKDASGYARDFFERIENGGAPGDSKVREALQTLGLVNGSKPTLKVPGRRIGGVNAGTAIGDNLIVSTQPADSVGVSDIKALIEKQNKAYEAGAAVPRIITGFEDNNGNVYQLQTRAPGINHRDDTEGVLNASDEQIDRLLYTLEQLGKVGLYPEYGGDNVMYDRNKGFTVIDLDLKDRHGLGLDNPENMVKEFINSALDRIPLTSDEAQKFSDRVWSRYYTDPKDRMVNADTIAAEKRAQAQAAQQKNAQNINVTTDNSDVIEAINKLGQSLGTMVAQEDTLQDLKNEKYTLNKEDITSAIKEGIHAKEFNSKYRYLQLDEMFNQVDTDQYQSLVTGELLDWNEAIKTFEKDRHNWVIPADTPNGMAKGGDMIWINDALDSIISNSDPAQNSGAQVIIQAIQDQTGKLIEVIKLLLPKDSRDELKISDALNTLANTISEWANANGEEPKDFFKQIMRGNMIGGDQTKKALTDLGMLSNSKVQFTLASEGYRNLGVAIGENMVIPTRPHFLDSTEELMPLLKEATKLGAAVPQILAAFNDGKRVFEAQTRMPGNNIKSDSSFMKATPAQIDKLIHTLEVLSKVGLFPDFIGDNVLFDEKAGFSLVDIETENIGMNPMDNPEDMVREFIGVIQRSGKALGLSLNEVQEFGSRVMDRFNLPQEQRLVDEFGNIKGSKEATPEGVQITPTLEEGAVAKAIQENVAQTPPVVQITPEIDEAGISNIVERIQTELSSRISDMDIGDVLDRVNTKEVAKETTETIVDAVEKTVTPIFGNMGEALDGEKLDKVIQRQIVGPDGKTTATIKKTEVSSEQTDDSFRTIKRHLKPGLDEEGKLTGEFVPEFIEIIDDIDKLRKAEKKEAKDIERAQKKVNEFLAKFKSKSGGNAQFIKGFNELEADVSKEGFISKENIDQIYNRMLELQQEYAKLETNFRKGQSSLNPFVNAINKAQSIENTFGAVELKFNGLIEKSEDLTSQFNKLRELSDEIKTLTDRMNAGDPTFGVADFEKLSVLVGEFTTTKNQVDGLLKNETKTNKNIVAEQKARVQEWVRLSKQLGVLEAKINSGLFDDATVEQAKKEAELVRKKIDVVLAEIRNPSDHLVTVGDANIAAEDKTINAQMSKRIGTLASQYEQLGRLQAQAENAGAIAEREKYEQLKKEVEAETEQIGLNKEENAGLLEILKTQQEAAYVSEKDLSIAKDRKKLFEEWIELVRKISALDAKIESGLFDEVTVENAKASRDALNKQIDAIMPQLDLSREDYIYASSESKKSEDATILAQRQKLFKALAEDYTKLGEAQAKSEVQKTRAAQTLVEQLTQQISAQKAVLNLSEEELEVLEAIGEQARTNKSGVLSAKEQDKLDRAKLQSEKKLSKRRAMIGKAGSAIGRADNVWLEAASIEDELPQEFLDRMSEYEKKLDALKVKHNKLSNSPGPITKKQREQLIEQTVGIDALTGELGELISQYQRLSGATTKELGATALTSDDSWETYKRELTAAVMEATKGQAKIKGFNWETKSLTYSVKTGAHEFTEYTAAVRELDKQMVSVQGATKRTETFFEATKRKMGEISSYVTGMSLMSRATQELRRGIQYIREIDLALTELRKVTNETEEEYDQFLKTAAKTGKKLGTTISAVTEATATFAKLGYSMDMAAEMAESAIVYKNVGDNIASTEDAADSIISTLKGFGMEASEAMRIVDRFNEVGNRFAITSQGIGEALRLSASALNEGKNSLDESIALITAANEVVNDPSSVGTALKTLTLRLRGSKTE